MRHRPPIRCVLSLKIVPANNSESFILKCAISFRIEAGKDESRTGTKFLHNSLHFGGTLHAYLFAPFMLESIRAIDTTFDPAICWQAINTRDGRFDGRFFAGVITTKVYCRSICPIPLRKPENVKLFASAASAEAQGFRPCRRCRPHISPGTPAWHGTMAVVSRALRLIEGGALDHGNVDELAEHVGIGARHLRRLFKKHLGATPVQIANARRVRFARHLLNDNSLPVNKVARSAGFRSIRQFNHSMRSSFGQFAALLGKVSSLNGLDEATSQYVAMRASGDPDLFLDSDLGVRRALSDGCPQLTRSELQRAAERWRPWGAYATMYVWIAARERIWTRKKQRAHA